MRSRSRSESQGSFHNVSVKLILAATLIPILLLTVCLRLFNYQQDDNSHDNKSKLVVGEDQQFIWSHKLNDWTLSLSNSQESEHRNSDPTCIWPDDCQYSGGDRIINQLKLRRQTGEKIFKIFVNSQELSLDIQTCYVNQCQITNDRTEADALIFPNADVDQSPSLNLHRSRQIWIAYLLESPVNTFDQRFQRTYRGVHVFNWTASYRTDSDLVTPYSKFVPYENVIDSLQVAYNLSRIKHGLVDKHTRELIDEIYASATDEHKRLIQSKQGKVAWFASNCYAKNNRLELAKELSDYMQVDIYGRCGNLTCEKWNQTGCFQKVNNEYKFYLAFENSNCHQYITEKLYRNSYHYNDPNHLVLPIVLGASKREYERFAPPDSFIHVDDFASMKDLAYHLKRIDEDDALFYSYFNWKKLGKFIDTEFMCRVCALLHHSHLTGKFKSYPSIKEWWNNHLDSDSRKLVPSCKV